MTTRVTSWDYSVSVFFFFLYVRLFHTHAYNGTLYYTASVVKMNTTALGCFIMDTIFLINNRSLADYSQNMFQQDVTQHVGRVFLPHLQEVHHTYCVLSHTVHTKISDF